MPKTISSAAAAVSDVGRILCVTRGGGSPNGQAKVRVCSVPKPKLLQGAPDQTHYFTRDRKRTPMGPAEKDGSVAVPIPKLASVASCLDKGLIFDLKRLPSLFCATISSVLTAQSKE